MHRIDRPHRALALALLLVFTSLLLLPAAGSAQDVKVGVVDTRRLAQESRVGTTRLAQLEALGNRLKAEVEKRQKSLDQDMQRFRTRATTLSREEREKERDRLDQERIELQRMAEDAQRRLQREGARIEKEIQKTVLAGLQDFSRREEYDLMLDHLQCLFNSEAIDVTDQVLRFLDAEYPGT